MKKVFVCGFRQESNSFDPLYDEFDTFASFGIYEGEEAGKNFQAVCGMYKTLKENAIETRDGVVMRSASGGPVTSDVGEWFLNKITEKLNKNEVDGVLIALHGATVTEKSEDVCGDIPEYSLPRSLPLSPPESVQISDPPMSCCMPWLPSGRQQSVPGTCAVSLPLSAGRASQPPV